jgi:hypothetical protein
MFNIPNYEIIVSWLETDEKEIKPFTVLAFSWEDLSLQMHALAWDGGELVLADEGLILKLQGIPILFSLLKQGEPFKDGGALARSDVLHFLRHTNGTWVCAYDANGGIVRQQGFLWNDELETFALQQHPETTSL